MSSTTVPPLSRGDRLTDAAATLGTILVSLCSFLLSLHALTLLAGESGIGGPLRYAVSFSIDGLQLTASMLILSRTRLGQGTALPWLVLIASTGLSALGNVAAAPANPIAQTMYGLGPMTLAVSFHLLMLQIRSRLDRRAAAVNLVQEVREVQVQVQPASREVRSAPVNQVHPEVRPEVQVQQPEVQVQQVREPRTATPRATTLHLVPSGDGTDLKAVAYAALDALAERGVSVTDALDWRTVLAEAPDLAAYSRPDRQIPQRVAGWLKAQNNAAA